LRYRSEWQIWERHFMAKKTKTKKAKRATSKPTKKAAPKKAEQAKKKTKKRPKTSAKKSSRKPVRKAKQKDNLPDLIVRAGSKLVVSQPLDAAYRNFTMEDNSTIIVQINATIRAQSASFGKNCLIDGSGAYGADGINGQPGANQPAFGQLGVRGRDGIAGADGANGRDIEIHCGIEKIGGLTIKSNGGNGGRGGFGGNGGQGGAAHCIGPGPLKGGDGGDGGNGGAGGRGGDAGQITFLWALRSTKGTAVGDTGAPPNIVCRSVPGLAGLGGAGGRFGDGGAGDSCGLIQLAAGGPGKAGMTAHSGINGASKAPNYRSE
jgi:hypothetical protein